MHVDESNSTGVNDLSSTITTTTTTTSSNVDIASSFTKNINVYRGVSQSLSISGNNRSALQSINSQRDVSSHAGLSVTRQNFDPNASVAST